MNLTTALIRVSQCALYSVLFVAASSRAGGSITQYSVVPDEMVLGRLALVSRLTQSVAAEVFEVKGERRLDSGFLPTQTLVLYPGSRLILSGGMGFTGWSLPEGVGQMSSQSVGGGQEVYIVAESIRVMPGSPPPIITWDKDLTENRLPPFAGKARSGQSGATEGGSGASGANGAQGNPGLPGKSGPTLFLVTQEISGGKLYVDLSGQPGGPGGEGQAGGDGGSGQRGALGKNDIFSCRAGPSAGGDGGNGGNGGRGGIGGRGGDGGSLVLVAPSKVRQKLEQAVELVATEGPGGAGGRGGAPGAPGLPGPAAPQLGMCGAGTPGRPGTPGLPGPNEESLGQPGTSGRAYSVELNSRNGRLLGF